ncbi:putative oxidoreductase [Lasiodiplodia theobromae]|uniref:Putative oxidoreductase n=2 Tax=Lasiodiplodia theobromae TaxID=45133 RepID=A0A5N5DPQ0_9PEZI|nr:putative oxidoreductase [Lasiodiplodia theobromae]
MVVGPGQVSAVLFDKDTGAVHGLRQNAIIIITSTVPPEFCEEVQGRLHGEFGRRDVTLLDCPVSGGTTGAAAGTLTIFSSGTDDGLDKAQPVLKGMGTKLCRIPGGIGFGSKAKMCHQIPPEVQIALSNEVMAFAAKAGLNTQATFDAVQASDGWSWVNGNRIPHMLEGDKSVYSAVPNSLKDSSIIVNYSRLVDYPVFLTATAEQVYKAGINAGWAKDDDSTLWRLYLSGYPDDTVHQMTKPGCTLIPRQDAVSVQDIINIFVGTHLATCAETMGFTEAVGLDTAVMYQIFSKAAGASTQFIEQVPKMKKPTWSLRDVPEARDILKRMASRPRVKKKVVFPLTVKQEFSMVKASSIGAAMPIAAAAVQVLKQSLQ